ncbi:hypothetical protein Pelo_4580 [Pelomyxa schiedti]|nr:hypothetical protein Pelo_4580 [Pelomyxa schiedti]
MLKRREGNFNQLEDHLGKVEEQVRRKDELILSLKTKRSRRTSHHTTGNQSGAAQKTEQSNPTEELHKELEELRLSYANLVKEHTDLQEKLISIRKNDSTSPPSASSELPKVLHNSGGPTEGASNCTTESSEKSTWTPRTGLRSFNNGSDIESDDSSISTSSSKESKAIPISLEQEIQEEIKDEQTHKKCCMELDSLTRRYNDLEEVHKKLQETSEELVRDAKTKSQNLQNQLEQQQAVHVDRMSQLQLELETEQTRNKELQARSSKAIAEAKAKELQLETQSRQALGRVSTLEQEVTRLRSTYQQALKKLAANQETCTRLEAEAANRSKEMEEMERTMTNISKKLHEASRTRPERDLSQSPTLIPQLPSRFISPQSSPPNAPSPMMNPPSPRSNPTSPIMIPQTPPYKMKTVVQKVIMQQDSLKQVKQLALENSLKQATEAKNAIELEYNALRQLHEQTEESLASALNLQQQLQTRCDEQCLELSQNTKKFEEERATLLHDISDTKFKLESALIELGQTKNRCVELAQQSTDLQHMLQHTNEAHTQQYAEYQAVIQSQSRKREELEVALTEATTKIKYLEQELNSACQNVGLLSEKLSQSTNTCKQLEQNLSVSREETRKIEALLAETRGNAQALETKKEEMRANLTSALDQVLQLNKMLEEEHNLHQKTTIQLHQAREELTNLQIRVEESTTSRKDSAIPDKEDSHSDTSPRDLANYTSQLESQLEAMQRELDAANRKLESAVDEKSCSNQVAQVESEHVVVQMEPASPTADPEKPHTEKTPLLHHSADPPLHTATSTVTAINILESELQPIKPKTCWKVPATALVTVALCCSCCCAVVCLWWVSRSKDK